VFPWLAQEAAADAYGILSVERRLGADVPVRRAVILSRMLSSSMYRDPNHATGHYVSDALALCRENRTDADAVQCAIATAYYTVGSLANDELGSPYPVDSRPELIYELGVQKIAQSIRVYQNIAQYKAQFSGADLSRFAFNETRATSLQSAPNTRTPHMAWPTITDSGRENWPPTTSAPSPPCGSHSQPAVHRSCADPLDQGSCFAASSPTLSSAYPATPPTGGHCRIDAPRYSKFE
jgi:hypothetical protein